MLTKTLAMVAFGLTFAMVGCASPDADVEKELGAAPIDVPDIGDDDPVVLDPAPELRLAGEYGGNGCPDTDATDFEISAGSATTWTFSGTVTGNDGIGQFYVGGAPGEEIIGPIETIDGSYSVSLPLFCSRQQVKLQWSNASCEYTAVYDVISNMCEKSDLRLTVLWDSLGSDWELHLIKPGGRINDSASDCTWTSCISSSPDWGVVGQALDDPKKDLDDVNSYGPESIYLRSMEAGTYTVMVEHWGSGSPDSDGFAILSVPGSLEVIQLTDLAPQHVRTVATIDWPSGVITPIHDVLDCSSNWSSGCQASIPQY
jgi:hypothetical protein